MALDTADRKRIWRGLMRHWSQLVEPLAFAKSALLAAIVATDNWIEGAQADYNAALPVAFRTSATSEQKTLLFCVVALARSSMGLLRRIVGEVD